MMKSLIAAAAIVAFGATSAAACGWKSSETVADLDVKTDKQQTAMQSTPADAGKTDRTAETERSFEIDRSGERVQLAVEPRIEDDAAN
jgi:hypothetical protein